MQRIIHETSVALAHHYDSARDAIDAVSDFEAATLDEWDYSIRKGPGGYTVEVRVADEGPTAYVRTLAGFLEPRP